PRDIAPVVFFETCTILPKSSQLGNVGRIRENLSPKPPINGTPLAYQMVEDDFLLGQGGSMNKPAEFLLLSVLGLGCLLPQGCATQSGSVGGDEYAEEQIDEPTIKHILPPEHSITASRPRISRAELSAINATGLPAGALSDVLFDFDQ